MIKVGAEADQNYQNYILRGKFPRAMQQPAPAAREVLGVGWGGVLQEVQHPELFKRLGLGVR